MMQKFNKNKGIFKKEYFKKEGSLMMAWLTVRN
jgi:hypothetical protein